MDRRRARSTELPWSPQGVPPPAPDYRALAVETGGQILRSGYESLSSAFSRLLDDFRSSYVLHYTPAGVASTGFHTLGVRVKREGTFEVRPRRGYVAD
jgi:hypothetical protein